MSQPKKKPPVPKRIALIIKKCGHGKNEKGLKRFLRHLMQLKAKNPVAFNAIVRATMHAERVVHTPNAEDLAEFIIHRERRKESLKEFRNTKEWKRALAIKRLGRVLKSRGNVEWN